MDNEPKKEISIVAAPNLALARREAPVPLALAEHYTDADLETIRNTIARDCNDSELVFFLTFCRSAGLDPFLKEVYAIKRTGKITFQMAIDGLRRRAHDTQAYAGMDPPTFGEVQTHNAGGRQVMAPEFCDITVYKVVAGLRVPFPARCYFKEYAPPLADKLAFKWRDSPFNQLEKCTEAKALRRAFPEQVRGLYAHEELDAATPAVELELPPEVAGAPIEVRKVEHTEVAAESDLNKKDDILPLTQEQEARFSEWEQAIRQADRADQVTQHAGVIEVDERLTQEQRDTLKAQAQRRWLALANAPS